MTRLLWVNWFAAKRWSERTHEQIASLVFDKSKTESQPQKASLFELKHNFNTSHQLLHPALITISNKNVVKALSAVISTRLNY